MTKLIYEKSVEGRRGVIFDDDVEFPHSLPEELLRSSQAELPEVSELDTVRHFTELSHKNFSVDGNFFPLGSCTMKYNPKITEFAAGFEGFRNLHPHSVNVSEEGIQGVLEIIYSLEKMLCVITGMDEASLQPMAGAQGELTGMLIARKYHEKKGNRKNHVIVPDTSHGTNPASASMANFRVVTVKTSSAGIMDFKDFKNKINSETAAVMLTAPNTLGIFNPEIEKIARLARKMDALLYCDGANMNALLGKVRPGRIGFDMIHINLHKTFGAPHGGGGPGSGPVCVRRKLKEFLPGPVVKKKNGSFSISDSRKGSIGYLSTFFGNFSVLVKAYAYILLSGSDGLTEVSEKAVLNANYLKETLKEFYEIPYSGRCMHEFVFSAGRQAEKGVSAVDIAKYLIEKGFHPPTVYFPLIVKEAMMIEPTETESRQTLDRFASAMKKASRLSETDPRYLKKMPLNSPVGRLDEARAAKELKVVFKK